MTLQDPIPLDARLCLGLLVAWMVMASGCRADSADLPSNRVELQARFSALIQEDRFRHAQWGVQIISLDTGEQLFAHNADRLLIPASNTKLFTAALALDRLGPDYRIRTSLLSRGLPARRGTLAGDLVVYGRGDPTFTAQRHQGDLDAALAPLVEAVTRAGIRRIRGDLVADASYFTGPTLGSGWEWDDLQYAYGAEVSALSINDNAVDVLVMPAAASGHLTTATLVPPNPGLILSNCCLTGPRDRPPDLHIERPLDRPHILLTGEIPIGGTGAVATVSVHAPAAWFGHLFKAALERRGVRIDGTVRAREPVLEAPALLHPPEPVELGGVESPPLRELLALMLKPSQNLYAQLLLLQVGAVELGAPGAGEVDDPRRAPEGSPATTAESAGIRALSSFLRRAGIPPDEVLFEEGSGLSRRHLVTPAAIIGLLRFMHGHPQAEVFRDALPIAGMDGTLRWRMANTAAAGKALAKTGTLRYVNALSGYVTSAAGERFAFAILLNNYQNPDPDRPVRADLDTFVVTLAGLRWRTGAAPDSR